MSIEEAPIRCRFCKDIIEVDKAGELLRWSKRVRTLEMLPAADVYKSVGGGGADNYI